jgi:DNA-binding MarR family transcriptional regulator
MNDELMQLKRRIAELERINAELVRENSALKAKPHKQTQQGGDKTMEILRFLFNNPQNFTASQIAAHFSMAQSAAQYHLDRLVLGGQVTTAQNLTEQRTSGNAVGYVITPVGRGAIVASSS